jgi:hypothetical protein
MRLQVSYWDQGSVENNLSSYTNIIVCNAISLIVKKKSKLMYDKIYVFYSDMKFKMAATAGLSLTLDPMGKMFQNAPIGSNVNLCPAVVAILDFRSA